MPRATERRNLMQCKFESLGLKGEFLHAVDGLKMNTNSLPTGTEIKLSPGEIGCYLSHVRSWETVAKRGVPHAIILEDDVSLSPNLMSVVREIIETNLPFDAVRLSALMGIRGITIATLSEGSRLVLPNKNPSGCQGYLISLAGANHLLSKLKVPKQPIDSAFDRYWKFGLFIPIVSPSVVEEDRSTASTIDGRFGNTIRKTFGRHLLRVFEAERRKITVYFMAKKHTIIGRTPPLNKH